jgi:hypothetical protein
MIKREIELAYLFGDGCIFWIPEKKAYTIQINRSLPSAFKRFVWAHEVAHTFPYLIEGDPELLSIAPERVGRFTSSKTERLCDEIAGELLMPRELLCGVVEERRPSLFCVFEIARVFNVTVTAAAFRLVQTTPINCLLVLWDFEESSPPILRPYGWLQSSGLPWTMPIPPLTEKESQPFVALISGKPQSGRAWIDLGGGRDCYYAESFRARHRNRPSVLTLFILDGVAPLIQARIRKDVSVQRGLFDGE